MVIGRYELYIMLRVGTYMYIVVLYIAVRKIHKTPPPLSRGRVH